MDMGFKIIDAIKSNNTCEQICKLNKNGILEKIIPEVKSMKEVGKCKYHKVDCFTHTIYALEEFEKLIERNAFYEYAHVYPTQLFESGFLFILFIVLFVI